MDERVARNAVFGEGCRQRTAHCFSVNGVVEAHVESGAARELDALIQTLGGQRANARDDHDGAERIEATAVADEVYRRVGEQVIGGLRVERDVLLVLEQSELVRTMALKSDVKMPMISVVAKPRMAPLPKE